MKIDYHPQASKELQEAAQFYESCQNIKFVRLAQIKGCDLITADNNKLIKISSRFEL